MATKVNNTADPIANRVVVTYPDRNTLHHAAGTRMLLALSDLLAVKDRVDISLNGGRDGIAMLAVIHGNPLENAVDWSRVHLWWGDERFVQVNDADRNAKQARDAWFGSLVERGLLPEENIHEMPADERTREQADSADDATNQAIVDQAAVSYQQEIVDNLGSDGSFDIGIFGVGPDGHCASLFPDRAEVLIDDKNQLAAGVINSPKMPPLRVSLTVPFIHRCRQVWVVTTKAGKTEAINRALSGVSPHTPSSYAYGAERTIWMLDNQTDTSAV